MNGVIFVAILAVLRIGVSATGSFTIPEVKFEVHYPRGFRIRIPHVEGMQLFAFHGNVNNPLRNLEVGQYYKDVTYSINGYWIYEDRMARLRKGDKFYYWVYVLHNRLGYRRDDQVYTVNELITGPLMDITEYHPIETPDENNENNQPERCKFQTTTTTTIRPDVPTEELQACRATIQSVVQKLITQEEEISVLREKGDLLTEITERRQGGKKLTLSGRISNTDDPIDVVKFILREKLDLKSIIIEAVRNPDQSITFEVSSIDELLNIVRAVKTKLKDSTVVTILY